MLWAVVLLTFRATVSFGQTFDFEGSLDGWSQTIGGADPQPVAAVSDRFARMPLRGDYWRGLVYPLGQHGQWLIATSDSGADNLLSPEFQIQPSALQFSVLVGGTSDIRHERVSLEVRIDPDTANTLERSLEAWGPLPAGVPRRDGEYLVVEVAGGSGERLRLQSVTLPDIVAGLTARVRILDDSAQGHIYADFIRLTANTPKPEPQTVWGYADYHAHPMTYLAFGGINTKKDGRQVLWGNPGGNYDDYCNDPLLVSSDIGHCIRGHGGGYLAEEFINEAQILPNILDFDIWKFLFPHKRSGGPDFKNFPARLMGAHQQMHITQIHRNYLGGLRLMVALTTDNAGPEYITGKVVDGHVPLVKEQDSMEAQIAGIMQMAKLNSKWMEIADTPAKARDIILRNKLAVVPGVEMDQLGTYGYASAKEEIDHLWSIGVRAVVPIHAVNNLLGGPAIFVSAYNTLNDLLFRGKIDATTKELKHITPTFYEIQEDKCENDPVDCVMYKLAALQLRVGIEKTIFSDFHPAPWIPLRPVPEYVTHGGHKNKLGLLPFGKQYIRLLIEKGMILDTAHMSDQSVADTFGVIGDWLRRTHPDCAPLVYGKNPQPCDDVTYPAIISHAHFRTQAIHDPLEPIADFLPREYDITDTNLAMLGRVGGVVGPFVAEDRIEKGNIEGIKNDCWMTSKTFAFSFRYALNKLGSGVGMATDFTLIPQTGPRFGDDGCRGWVVHKNSAAARRAHNQSYRKDQQQDGIRYVDITDRPYVKKDQVPILPYKMGDRTYNFNTDGLAHFGMVPDMMQDLKNIGQPVEDRQAMFASAEGYIRMWEKAERLAGK